MAYTPPGVTVTEYSEPVVNPLLAVPASVCLVGRAQGYQLKTDAVTLSGTTAVVLPGVPTDATMTSGSIVSVMDASNPGIAPSGYVNNDDYDFNASAKTIARDASGSIPDNSTVYVTYKYTVKDYYYPIRLSNLADIEDRFGTAYNDAGTAINSRLTYAAQLAFENGAQDLVLLPLFYNNSGTRQEPNNTQAASASTWASNFEALRDLNDVNVIVPVVGQSESNVGDAAQLSIIQALQDHIKFMKTEQQYIMGVVGEDSSASSSVAQKSTLISHATTLAQRYGGDLAEQMIFVSPSKFTRAVPSVLGGTIAVGGQYAAAAIAGMIAGRPVSASMTRKTISGFQSVADFRTKAEKNADATAGLLVIEQRGQLVLIRHAITLDTAGGSAKREIGIVRAKHRVIESVRDTLEAQVIGQVVADNDAPLVVKTAVTNVLSELRSAGDIINFGDVQARILTIDPTHVEVRFSYRPAFPINYITVGFSLDLTTGVTTPTTNEVS